MPSRTLPNLGLKAFWSLGEDNYKAEMDANLLALSTLVQGGALDKVAALPGTPADGDVYILDETAGGDANKIAVRDAGAWSYFVPAEGWMLYSQADGNYLKFNGTAWSTLTIGLPDPATHARQFLAVKPDESGYELVDAPGTPGAEYTSATQWRIRVTAPGSDATNAGFGEVTFYDQYGDPVFLSGTLNASSEKAGFDTTKAIDSVTSAGNGWMADVPGTEAAVGAWWSQTFVTAVALSGMVMFPIAGDPASAPEGFEVEYYDTGGSTWVSVGGFTTTWPDDSEKYFPFTAAATDPGIITLEQVRDAVAAFITPGTGITVDHNDAGDTLTINAVLTNLLEFKGTIDCSANPNYPAAVVGDTYVVSVAGKIGGALGADVEVGDTVICTVDNAGGTQASVGADWSILNRNITGGGGTTPPFTLGWGFGDGPATAGETLFTYVFAEAVDFADDWSGSYGACGANPTASYVLTIYKNGASVGTVTLSTGGVATFATTGGAISFAAGDTIKVQGDTDATVADVAVTFKGTRA